MFQEVVVVGVVSIKEKKMKEWIDKIMHKKFHVGWVFLVLGIGIISCVTILVKIT